MEVGASPIDNAGLGNGTTPFSRSYAQGTMVTLSAPTTAGGNIFQKWQTNGIDCATTPTLSLSLQANLTATAVYASPLRSLTINSANPATGVEVGASPIDNAGLGNGTTPFSRSYAQGTMVTLSAPTTAGGNIFQKWQTNGIDCATTPTLSLSLQANLTVTAVYAAPNGLINGSFESGYTGWTTTGNQGISSSTSAADGQNFVAFNWGQTSPNGTLAQSFPTVSGQAYTLTFDLGVRAYNWNEQRLQVTVQGATVRWSQTLSLFGIGSGATRWVPQSYSFTADSTTTTLLFKDVSSLTDNLDLLLDNARVNAQAPNGLINGSFESGYTGWTTTGNQGISSSTSAADGQNFVAFNWGQTSPNGTLAQSFPTVSGQAYTLTFDLGVRAYNWNEQRLQVTVQGATVRWSQTLSLFGIGSGATRWVPESYSFTADSTTTTLLFKDVSSLTDNLDLLLDNVRVNAQANSGMALLTISQGGRRATGLMAEEPTLTLRLLGERAWIIFQGAGPGIYQLEVSEDLRSWRSWQEITATGSSAVEFKDVAPVGPMRFYRVVRLISVQ